MIAKLDEIEIHFKDLETQISDPDIMKDMKKYKEIAQEHSHLQETVNEIRQYKRFSSEISDAKLLIANETDADMKEMAQEELQGLENSLEASEEKLKALLIPKDPKDHKNIIMEIRAGTGGDEAALFAADLFRMYSRLAETRKWKVEVLSSNEINLGGFKEIVFSISGNSVYGDLKYESGTHRVQRVPTTESGGRVHTSAVTVAVLPEAEETDIDIKQEDLKIDVYRSSGPGGQSVNTTDSAVRITHLPTGVVVTCQDEKSQIKNKAKAMRVLSARIYEAEEARIAKVRSDARKSQVGSGDRSERIRTYNFPQNRLTDHRINLTLYKLDSIMEGNVEEVVEALKLSYREEYLKLTNSRLPMTYRQALTEGSARLQSGNILFCDTPFLDASVLLAFAAGLTREKLFASYPDQLPPGILDKFTALIGKRLKGLPVSYIRNQKEFFGRDFYVDARVLVPRPDTECIIEKALNLTAGRENLKVLDLCTGSGCIAITLKLEDPGLKVTASDISSDALDVAEANAEYLDADIDFIKSDLFLSISGKFEIIVTNPPYVCSSETNGMVRSGWPEPVLALDGGNDGLDLIREIVKNSLDYLSINGYLLIESGPEQAETIKELMKEAGFCDIEITTDLAGRNRITSGRTSGS